MKIRIPLIRIKKRIAKFPIEIGTVRWARSANKFSSPSLYVFLFELTTRTNFLTLILKNGRLRYLKKLKITNRIFKCSPYIQSIDFLKNRNNHTRPDIRLAKKRSPYQSNKQRWKHMLLCIMLIIISISNKCVVSMWNGFMVFYVFRSEGMKNKKKLFIWYIKHFPFLLKEENCLLFRGIIHTWRKSVSKRDIFIKRTMTISHNKNVFFCWMPFPRMNGVVLFKYRDKSHDGAKCDFFGVRKCWCG